MLSGSARGALGGIVALVLLETLLTSKQTGNVAGLFQWPAAFARWFIDPTVPGLPDRSKTPPAAANSTTAPATGSAGTVTVPAPPPATAQGKLALVKTA